ncbi:hypothetical protein JZ751_003787 [Albula glossodonta]|uniref:Uncharacterized protein n=1 Tax=Albula glossodonta TaxID=121402 RepID=A0A8T2PDQ1_9TELE|nr:hypothetical protein JZ751_003787 [Albula glossodonta]
MIGGPVFEQILTPSKRETQQAVGEGGELCQIQATRLKEGCICLTDEQTVPSINNSLSIWLLSSVATALLERDQSRRGSRLAPYERLDDVEALTSIMKDLAALGRRCAQLNNSKPKGKSLLFKQDLRVKLEHEREKR